MATGNLLSTLQQSLRQTRSARIYLVAQLAELQAEAEATKAELAELDLLSTQTEAAISRLLSSFLNVSREADPAVPTDAELEAAMQDDSRAENSWRGSHAYRPVVRNDIEVKSNRFMERTIPQATGMLLREAGGPLHVNEIYNRLLEGGFNFSGQNPTISIAVSLNRNGRFRKVSPGTFDLVIRDASQTL